MGRWRGVRIAVPVLLLVPLVCLMVGCVYVPWFEQRNLNGAPRDFRDLSGKSAADPITDGRITKAEVVRLLGPPAAQSPNGRVIAYTLTTKHGVWIEPLCLNVTPGGQHLYVVGLRFDATGVLEHHRFVEKDLGADFSPLLGFYQFVGPRTRREALQEIDADNGVVRSVRPDVWHRPDQPAKLGVREDWSVAGPGNPFTGQ